MKIFEVCTTIRLRLKAAHVNAAENHAISMIEQHLSDMADSPAVVETAVCLSPDNPKTVIPTKVWISALVPKDGLYVYEGVRLQASLSERDCYKDLAEWLDLRFRGVAATIKALDGAMDKDSPQGYHIRSWKVEEQEVYP